MEPTDTLPERREREPGEALPRRSFADELYTFVPPAQRCRLSWWRRPSDVVSWFRIARFHLGQCWRTGTPPCEVVRGWLDFTACPQCAIRISSFLPYDECQVLRGWAMLLAVTGAAGHPYDGWHW